ncbi:hypothetical protein RJ640_009399 [Escallonia rubra]|uniref:Exostosin GT47 domain-containing protein n=1 Tax=Escallonia rubra TaxID=112253 RepID=A0AA88QDW6_9ASTE|nr:hypothetical protein RJ640_009399 [Escallonia rubra]
MAVSQLSLLLFHSLLAIATITSAVAAATPYLSPTTLFPNYQKMLTTFKIYTYTPPSQFTSTVTTQPESLFTTSLLASPFVTQDPEEAHLFFLPFHPDLPTRSLARQVRELRQKLPYWNRTLGADHVFLSLSGIDYSSDRNSLELKKNSVQISRFPTTSGHFIPHKDITLPPLNPSPLAVPHAPPANKTATYLGYMRADGLPEESSIVNELINDPDFVIGSQPSDGLGEMGNSKFCLFVYGGEVTWIGEAMAAGCVPAVVADRPIQDLPLMDVLRWTEIAVFVGTRGGARGLKEVLRGVGEERYERMKGLGAEASRHLAWNAAPQPHDAFHMVMYQLWLRRHTIRYTRREWV